MHDIRITSGWLEHSRFWSRDPIGAGRPLMRRERRYRGIQIKYLGNPSNELCAIILGNIATLSDQDAARLAKFGVTVAIVSWIPNLDPALGKQTPRGWPEDKTWHDADGGYMKATKTAAIAENTREGKSRRSAFVAWHELGHATDHALGDYSHSAAFKSAYNDDTSILSKTQREQLSYFLQEGNAGPEEAFAQIYAAINTATPGSKHEILHLFPECTLQIIGRLQESG